MKAKGVHICIFTAKPPNQSGGYAPEILGNPESGMYTAASAAGAQLLDQDSIGGTTLSICYAGDQQFADFLQRANRQPPFIAIGGTFPDGAQKYYIVPTAADTKKYLRAMWLGDFGGTGIPDNLGDADGGWGEGHALICKIIPPLCALGFLPWLALAGFATYKAAESRSTTGKLMWGAPAMLLWYGFFERGGVKQIQYWMKKI